MSQKDPLEKGSATHSSILGLPWWLRWWRICLQCGRPGFHHWVGRTWHSTPVFLPGESPRIGEPGGPQSMGLQRDVHNWATKHSTHHEQKLHVKVFRRKVKHRESMTPRSWWSYIYLFLLPHSVGERLRTKIVSNLSSTHTQLIRFQLELWRWNKRVAASLN